MDAKEVVQRMKDFGLKGVRDGSAHLFVSPDLLAEFVQSEIIAEREACAQVCEGQTEGFAVTSTWDEAALSCARSIRMRANA